MASKALTKLSRARAMQGRFSSSSSQQQQPVEAPDSIATLSYYRSIDLICEGPVRNVLKNGLQSLYLDDTPVQNADSSQNWLGVSAETRPGNPTQTPLQGFPQTETLISVNSQVKYGVPAIRTITDPLATVVRFAIQIPALLQQDSQGNVNGTNVTLSLDVQPIGGSWTLNQINISGKTRSQQVLTYEIALPSSGSGSWNVRCQRLTIDSNVTTLSNDTYLQALIVVDNYQFIYPDRALCAIQVDAYAVGGSDVKRTYLGDWLEIQIPSNYNPDTRVYTGVWDGTFTTNWTNNPVWVLYDLITNPRYGLGRYVGTYVPDKFALYTIAQYCDVMISDGFGGTEPRYTFNGPVTQNVSSREDAMRVIQSVASIFNGNVYWGTNTVHVWADMPADSVKLVSPANVIDGKFTYSSSSAKTEHTVALVTWRDPNNNYSKQIEVVTNNKRLYQIGWREITISTPGICSRGLAHRIGRWVLDTEENATETVTYTAALDHADVVPGDVIEVADPVKRAFRGEGRIKAVPNSSALTLDAPFTFILGVSYQIAITLPDGSTFLGTVTNAPATTANITIAETMSTSPMIGAVWVMRCSNAETREFRVLINKETDKHQFEITALLYDSTKYARIEQNLNFIAPSYTAYPKGPITAPYNLTASEALVLSAGVTVRNTASFSWTAAPDARVQQYEFQYGLTTGGFSPAQFTTSTNIDVIGLTSGAYNVRVRSLTALGQTSVWVNAVVNLLALNEPPADVTNFNLVINGDNAIFSWDPCPTLNWDHYELRYSSATSSVVWEGCQTIMDNIKSTSVQMPLASGTYLIKAVTTQGIDSVNPALIENQIDPGELRNVVVTDTESPTFSGTKLNCTVGASNLRLASTSVLHNWSTLDSIAFISNSGGSVYNYGKYSFGPTDLGSVMTCGITFSIHAIGYIASYKLAQWVTLHSVKNLEGTSLGSYSLLLSYRTTNTDPSASPTWSAWAPLAFSDVTCRGIEFQLELFSDDGYVSPSVSTLSIVIDVPDRFESATSVASGAGPKAITFTYAFQSLAGVAVAGLNMATGDYFAITSKSATGFTVEFYNSSGTPINRNFDWIARGYGQLT